MNTYVKNGRLVAKLIGKIDASTAPEVDRLLRQAISQYPDLPLTLDADQLEYISSTGLRVILKLVREDGKALAVVNASPAVYEVFEVTGINTLIPVEKQLRRLDVADCPVIGVGAFGTVYRLNSDTVVKVFRDGEASLPIIRDETNRARQAFLMGVPTAIPFDIVRVGDQYGSVFEMINAQNCNDLVARDPSVLDDLLPRYAAFLNRLHAIEARPGVLPSARALFLKYLSVISASLDGRVSERLKYLLESMPEDLHLVHGDIHLKNLMTSSGEMILIDMDKLCTGNPIFEFASLCATYVLFNEDSPDDSMKFFGISAENSRRIYAETLRACLGNPDEEAFATAGAKVRTLSLLRFLKILLLEHSGVDTPLKKLQVRHASEELMELVFQVDSLAL